jgi:competence protein CoiA
MDSPVNPTPRSERRSVLRPIALKTVDTFESNNVGDGGSRRELAFRLKLAGTQPPRILFKALVLAARSSHYSAPRRSDSAMLIAKLDGRRVDARNADRRAPHICPGCDNPVVLHRGKIVAAHFKHKREVLCDWAKGETSAHLDAKSLVRAEFERRGAKVETEFIVDTMPGDRRADVMVWSPRGHMFAFELQHTPVDPSNIAERVAAYARIGIRQCWIPFIPDDVWDNGRAVDGGWKRLGYTPRAYEVWLHRMHAGAGVWMYDRRGKLLARHSETAQALR